MLPALRVRQVGQSALQRVAFTGCEVQSLYRRCYRTERTPCNPPGPEVAERSRSYPARRSSAVIAPRRSPVRVRLAPSARGRPDERCTRIEGVETATQTLHRLTSVGPGRDW